MINTVFVLHVIWYFLSLWFPLEIMFSETENKPFTVSVYPTGVPCCMIWHQTQRWSLLGSPHSQWLGERRGAHRPPLQEARHWWAWCLAVQDRKSFRVVKSSEWLESVVSVSYLVHLCSSFKRRTHHAPARFSFFHSDVLKETGKAFIKPEVIPPVHSHNVPKPLETNNWHEPKVSKQTYEMF